MRCDGVNANMRCSIVWRFVSQEPQGAGGSGGCKQSERNGFLNIFLIDCSMFTNFDVHTLQSSSIYRRFQGNLYL